MTDVCVRCQRPVVESAEHYQVFERMHWVCFHLEYEHSADPDVPCSDPSCFWREGARRPGSVIKRVSRMMMLGGDEAAGWLPEGAATPQPTPRVELEVTLSIVREAEG